jgi:hypothetical protein
MAGVASIVGAEDTRPHERSHPASAATPRRWVTFSFGSLAMLEAAPAGEEEGPRDLYRLEVMRGIRGATLPSELTALTPSCPVARREMESLRPPSVAGPALQGSVDAKHSSDEEETRGLTSAWSRSPWRVALVLLFTHCPEYWTLPREGRSPTYLGWSAAQLSRRPGIMGRVLRRLYRAGSLPASQWDYLAYLEMQPQDVAHVRDQLAELRDARQNPLRSMVVREAELWLTKQVNGTTTPTRLAERVRDRIGA